MGPHLGVYEGLFSGMLWGLTIGLASLLLIWGASELIGRGLRKGGTR